MALVSTVPYCRWRLLSSISVTLFIGSLLLLLPRNNNDDARLPSATSIQPAASTNTKSATLSIITKPILFLHGVGGHADEFDDIIAFLNEKYGHDAPPMHSIDTCEGSCSLFTSMPQQRDALLQYLQSNADNLNITNGFHWVAHSQGAILARSVIQEQESALLHEQQQQQQQQQLPLLCTHVFVSMAGPQMGQWGECTMNRTDIPESLAKKMSRKVGWMFFYNAVAQRELSFANYWHDPAHEKRMVQEATLLPGLNGYYNRVANDMARAKHNFLQLDKAVFVGSADDDCINPPLSSVFQFVDKNGTVQPFENSLEYRDDTFGLKTMMQQGRLVRQSYPGLLHLSWRKPQVFEKYVLPHLLEDVIVEGAIASS